MINMPGGFQTSMKCIIPLAGPDFFLDRYNLPKPLYQHGGSSIIERTLMERPWFGTDLHPDDLIFVLNKNNLGNDEFINWIGTRLSGAKNIILSTPTTGALLTSLAAAAYIEPTESIIIDLIDIEYSVPGNSFSSLVAQGVNGIVPYFTSYKESYSYLEIDKSGLITRAAEKQVISQNASAGTYYFASLEMLTAVLGKYILPVNLVNDMYYICPVFNHIEGAFGMKVELVNCFSTMFKKS